MTFPGAPDRGIVSLASPFSFVDTVRRIQSGLAEHGIKVFASIDQAAEAERAGLALPPTTLIVFGNPKAGTPLMLSQPLCGLDLPLKALVTQSATGEVTVSMNAADYIIKRHALAPDMVDNLAPGERLIARLLTS
jgi:uncharacterized protein (DUF302 family)